MQQTQDTGSVPGSRRSPGVGNGNPLEYAGLENFMNRRDWWATVHGRKESDTIEQLSIHTHARIYSSPKETIMAQEEKIHYQYMIVLQRY